MRGNHFLRLFLPCLLVCTVMASFIVQGAGAEIVTFSGTVTYTGSHMADTLFVVVVDTTGSGEYPEFLAIGAFAVGAPPYSQPFNLSFDNALATGPLIMAAALDIDGGGVQNIGAGDLVGWYENTQDPVLLPSTASQANLDFYLPLAEIHGTVTFVPDQLGAYISPVPGLDCEGDHFQPTPDLDAPGPYIILGLYPGTYCVHGKGFTSALDFLEVCYGDPDCASPTLLTVTGAEIFTDVDLDFTTVAADEPISWGAVKSAYR